MAHLRVCCRFMASRDELQQTRNKLAERREIEKAKGILMKRRGIDEEAAFALMRRMAMDQKARLGDIAARIIEAAELLG